MLLPLILTLFLQGTAFGSGFTDHFSQFLSENYPAADFSGAQAGVNSSYGGKLSDDDQIIRRPVVLVHGSTDRALGGHSGGWTITVDALKAAGYQQSEIYALTWGDGQQSSGVRNNHTTAHIDLIRDFIEAVLAYTGSEQADIIAHSMGVTLTRGAIKGVRPGVSSAQDPLPGKIHTFIAIAGANAGVGACLNPFSEFMPTCSKKNGFHPESAYLTSLNNAAVPEAARIFTLWSHQDDVLGKPVIGRTNPVPPQVTCQLPTQTMSYPHSNLSHLQVRDNTMPLQLELLGH